MDVNCKNTQQNNKREIIKVGIINKLFGKKKESDEELKAAVLKKATEHWNANNEASTVSEKGEEVKQGSQQYEILDKVKKKNVRITLLEIAERGDTGVLPITLSDTTGINQQDTATALAFLTKEQYVEAVNSVTGFKYYLTAAGRKYCISKEFNA